MSAGERRDASGAFRLSASRGLGPVRAASMSAASVTVRVIGPA